MLLNNCTQEKAASALVARRDEVIRNEQADPLRHGWEPPIWKIADALLGLPCYDPGFLRKLKRRFDLTWDQFAEKIRKQLGFDHSVMMLLILGANRSAKSEYSAKRGQLILSNKTGSRVYPFHMSNPRSVRDQQPLFWKYMPPEWQVQTTGLSEYVKYKKKTGFSEGSFINAIGSECAFLNYMQDRDTALEGLEPDLLLPDELVPPDWLETMKYRLATRAGKAIVTFTPINGYTPSVKMFLDGAKITRESIGYMLPRDGGEPLPASQLGLSREEYGEICRAEIEKRLPQCPQSRPEDCLSWIEGRSGQVPPPEGRRFEFVPRVAKPIDSKLGVIWFHAGDNPYGNPKEVIQLASTQGSVNIRIRVYGKTEKTFSSKFPKFSTRVHVIDHASIPTVGTNYQLMDPAGDRNFFLLWIRATQDAAYIYRDWPGHYHIPNIGVPDPWAIPSGKKEGRNDGARGEGQESFGFGLLRYKFELARLEGWKVWREWAAQHPEEAAFPEDEELIDWQESPEDLEIISRRIVDSRAASNPRVENDRPVTLYQDLLDLNLDFELACGSAIEDGITRINGALDYTQGEEQSFLNRPKLYVSSECRNVIFAMESWLGVDGEHGATKDPIDLIRYYFTAEDTGFQTADVAKPSGFYYGEKRAEPTGVRIRSRRRPACMDRAIFRR